MTTRLPDLKFWRGKRVFLTGHTGFKGGWLCLVLERLGALWSGLSLRPGTTPNLFELADIHRDGRHIFADIRDAHQVKNAIDDFQPEFVFHLAAQPLVRRSHRDPMETFTTNVIGTVNILEAVRFCDSVKTIVVVTTDKVYRNNESGAAFCENDALGGHDPYSASKAAAEMVVQSYRQSFFTNQGKCLSAARAGNVIGGGDWSEDRILPDAVRAWGSGHALKVRHPDAVRPWQHVLEPICGYLRLAEKIHGNPGNASDFNFGPDPVDQATVRKVVELAQSAFGSGSVEWGTRSDFLHEAHTLSLENTKAKTELGVLPVWRLEEAVRRTMLWYRRQADGANARALCEQDIEAFFQAE